MANKSSAKKMIRKIAKREVVNKSRKSSMRTYIKKFLVSIEESKPYEEVCKLFQQMQSVVAKSASKKIIHHKTASRKVRSMHSKLKQYGSSK